MTSVHWHVPLVLPDCVELAASVDEVPEATPVDVPAVDAPRIASTPPACLEGMPRVMCVSIIAEKPG